MLHHHSKKKKMKTKKKRKASSRKTNKTKRYILVPYYNTRVIISNKDRGCYNHKKATKLKTRSYFAVPRYNDAHATVSQPVRGL